MVFQRRTVLVLVLVCLFVIFLNLKPEESDPADKSLTVPERVLIALYSPVTRGFNIISDAFKSTFRNYLSLVGTRKENSRLKADLAWRQSEIASLQERLIEVRQRAGLQDLSQKISYEGVTGRVVAYDPLAGSQSIWIDAGSEQGVALDQPVIAPEGLVGRVIKVTGNLSQVLLLADPHFAVDVVEQQSRVRALVVGLGRNAAEIPHPPLMSHLEYLRLGSELHRGDLLVTSGLSSLYPPGLPVGTVLTVETSGDGSFFKSSKVLPMVDFGKLETVLVLTKPLTPPPPPAAKGRAKKS